MFRQIRDNSVQYFGIYTIWRTENNMRSEIFCVMEMHYSLFRPIHHPSIQCYNCTKWVTGSVVQENKTKRRRLGGEGVTEFRLSISKLNVKVKVKQSHYRPWGFQEVEAPRFHDNRHLKVVSLSALRTGRLYPKKHSWYSFLLEAESTPGRNWILKYKVRALNATYFNSSGRAV
jgi:hypothetical protein